VNLSFLNVLFLSCSVGIANAEPLSGTLIGDVSKDILNYECVGLNGARERISCDFVQVLLMKKSKPADLGEEVEQFLSEFDAESETTFKTQFCSLSLSLDAVVKGNLDARLETMDRTDLVNAIDAYQSSPPKAQEDLNRLASNLRDACIDPTDEMLVKMFSAMHEQATRSCEVFVNKYTQTYVKVSDTLWAVESTPSGVCGVVNTSRFIGDAKYGGLWEHETSKIVMNKEGAGLLKCADLDEAKTLYSWKGRRSNFLGCDYIN
jgi:hypothetical protein